METPPTQALSIAGIAAKSKSELTAIAQALVADVAESGGELLELLALSAKMEHYAAAIKTAAKAKGLTDLATYGKPGVAKSGVKMIIKETGVRYDYSEDLIWSRCNDQLLIIRDNQKAQEELLRVLPVYGMGLTDPETGETYHAYPPAKTATETIQATIL